LKEYKLEIESIKEVVDGAERTPEKLEGVKGYVVINVPSMKERMALMKEIGYKEGGDTMALAANLMDQVDKLLKEVSIECGDVKCESADDLGYYEFGIEVMNRAGSIAMSGIPVGKK
jgi:hypothetical protein